MEQKSGGGVVLSLSEYVYDAQNRRIAQITNGQALWTVYDREHAWADYTVAGAVAARFLYGDATDDIVARWTPAGGTAWHLSNKFGTVRDVAGATGAVVNHLDYSAFGQILSQTNAAAGDRFTFTGREWDAAIGDYFYRARSYDPTSGRFTAVDPIGMGAGDPNFFRYIRNSPNNGTDPSGKLSLISKAIIVTAIVGAIGAIGVGSALEGCIVNRARSLATNAAQANNLSETEEDAIRHYIAGCLVKKKLGGSLAAALFVSLGGLARDVGTLDTTWYADWNNTNVGFRLSSSSSDCAADALSALRSGKIIIPSTGSRQAPDPGGRSC